MAIDNAATFLANPLTFIAGSPIVLDQIGQNMPGGAFPPVNNQRSRFTLSTGAPGVAPAPGSLPRLRMQPAAVPAGGVVPQPPLAPLATLDAYYCHAGIGGVALNALPYVDIPIAPGPADAHLLFTTGMNGCALFVASAVDPAAPALAAGHWRVLHDPSHRSLAALHAGNYVIHFAAYVDAVQPGPVSAAWAAAPIVRNYNPNNYPFALPPPAMPMNQRVITNFLWWGGAHWNFGSKHYHLLGASPSPIDAPPGAGPNSTQSCAL
jgi:hypothetical protein